MARSLSDTPLPPIPEVFLRTMQPLLGSDFRAFSEALEQPAAIAIKLNARKCKDAEEAGYGSLERVEWCDNGYYLPYRPKFTLNPLLHAGVFYVQDPSSMIYEEIVRKIVALEGGESECGPLSALDLCAAPGGKSTSMLNALPTGSHLTANDATPDRSRALLENLLKWGYPNILVTNSPTSALARAGAHYDLVAVDAPCSGEGMMRKDATARTQWSPALVEKCSRLQRDILTDALATLRPGGYLIYSTCTFNSIENEQNLQWLTENFPLTPIDTHLAGIAGIHAGFNTDIAALRFLPHLTQGEGLFVALLRLDGNRTGDIHSTKKMSKGLNVLADSIEQMNVKTSAKGKVEIPRSEWSLSIDFPKEKYPNVELTEEMALQYLRHESLKLPEEIPAGFATVSYQGHRLGFVKNLKNRANNLYPASWRIKNL